MPTEIIRDAINAQLQNLRASYLDRAAADLAQMVALLETSDDPVAADQRDQLRLCLHRLAGSAGTFGYTELGARARLMELQLQSEQECPDRRSMQQTLDKMRELTGNVAAVEPLVAEPAAAVPVIDGADELHLLIAGDDVSYCQLLASLLGTSFRVGVSNSGAEAIEYYRQHDVDIVLLDVGLPDMSGYDVCREMDGIRGREWRSVVFVSVNNSVNDKLNAYNAGGDDFIIKPIQLNEFVAKLRTLAHYTQSKKSLRSQHQIAQKMVFESMAETALYGRLVEFMRTAMGCRDNRALSQVFFDTMDNLGLKAALRIGGTNAECFSGPEQDCSPIEHNLLETLAGSGRLHHFGCRTVVNGRHLNFLIKNMPLEDEIAYGRLKDLVAVMAESLDASFVSIARQQALGSGVRDVGALLGRLSEGVLAEGGSVQQAMRRLDGLMRDLERGFHFLDLNEEQEQYLYGLLSHGARDAAEIVEMLSALREDLNDINRNLMRYAK